MLLYLFNFLIFFIKAQITAELLRKCRFFLVILVPCIKPIFLPSFCHHRSSHSEDKGHTILRSRRHAPRPKLKEKGIPLRILFPIAQHTTLLWFKICCTREDTPLKRTFTVLQFKTIIWPLSTRLSCSILMDNTDCSLVVLFFYYEAIITMVPQKMFKIR